MYQIRTFNKISPQGLEKLDPEQYEISAEAENPDAVLVRSANLLEMRFGEKLKAVVRVGAGFNNIPVERLSEEGVAVFNTPGANANAVKELTLCALLLASRDIIGGAEWVKEQVAQGADVAQVVEKGKAQFEGPELRHKTLGIIGLGVIGDMVANAAISLGMDVIGYDPFLSLESALRLDRHVQIVKDVKDLYKRSDYITLHTVLTDSTRGMINEEAVSYMKRGVRFLNLARGEIVDTAAMLRALETGRAAVYVTDFPNNEILKGRHVIGLPHLGASTPESELNCAVMAVRELTDYLETGNITNSVNYPSLSQDPSGVMRLCIIHRNIPAMLAQITALFGAEGVNVENLSNKSRGDYAYTIVDLGSFVGEAVIRRVRGIEGVIRVRSIVW